MIGFKLHRDKSTEPQLKEMGLYGVGGETIKDNLEITVQQTLQALFKSRVQ
jgi:hypothetical protein